MVALLGYVFYVPLSVIIAPPSENFTFDNFFTEVLLRWNGGSIASVLTIVTADLITYAPFGYLYYIYSQTNSTSFTSDQWYQFAAYSLVAYLA